MLRTISAPSTVGELASGPPSIDVFPVNYSILLAGPPGVGKFEYFLDLVKQSLERGKRVVFVTLDIHPAEVRERAKAIGLDIENFEGHTFLFVDCYSAMSSDKHEHDPKRRLYEVSSFSNLEGIGMAMAKASNDLKTPIMIFFYTLSTLFLHNSQQAIAKFMQIITSRVKTNLGFIAYAVHEGVHDQMMVNLLRSLVDGVIEARFTEDLRREIRIHHLRGLRANTSWVSIQQSDGIEAGNMTGSVSTRRLEP
jgi:KaiC/GvpD/RAD55 family RecA-like ATPase